MQSKLSTLNSFVVFTDGAYDLLRKVGGSAYVILNPHTKEEIIRWSEGYSHQTNNRCEAMAIIMAMEYLPEGSIVHVMTDSMYCITVLGNTQKRFEKNTDLIKRYRKIIKEKNLDVTFHFVRGHSGNQWNELCDQMCTEAMENHYIEREGLYGENKDWMQFL